MTVDPNKASDTRWQTYLKGLISFRPEEMKLQQSVRTFSKWFFDLLKNAVLVGALRFLATKSDSLVLKGAAEVASFMLLAYCFSYIDTWQLNLFHPLAQRRFGWGWWLNTLVAAAIYIALWQLIIYIIGNSVRALVAVQGKQ